jgi:hypothetical protein
VLSAALGGCGSSGSSSASTVAAASSGSSSTAVGTISRTGSTGSATSGTTTGGTATTGTATTGTSTGTTTTTGGTTTPVQPVAPVTPPTSVTTAPAVKKAIDSWVSCTGTSDDTAGVAQAFAAAKHGAFTLTVDCPVNIKIGSDISRTLFIDDGTSVEFTGAGKFTVDNVLIPAFVIADSSNITLTNWNVEYVGGLPIAETLNYENNGQAAATADKPGNAFNDLRLTQWLTSNKAINFDRSRGTIMSPWGGTTNSCAVFYLTGDTSNVSVTGMQLYVPKTAGGNRFIPVAFALTSNFKRAQTVSSNTPTTGDYYAVPHDLLFSNVTLDGTYMGWVGGLQNAVFENIHSVRYGDLQDAAGGNVGGVKKWFAPPHLFYFNYAIDGDAGLFNTNIQIKNVVDSGVRVGKARDAGGSDTISGYADSLKLGCVNCSVDGYVSDRPDGLMDVLNSDGLTISNVTATYNSSFTNNIYPGWRFPSESYKNVKFENISLTDTAESTVAGPIGNAAVAANQGLVLSNVQVGINKWGPGNAPFPTIAGSDNAVSLNYSMVANLSQYLKSQNGTVELELLAAPATVRVGDSVDLTWLSRGANSCSGDGEWSGSLGTNGAHRTKLTSAGTHQFVLVCRNSSSTTTTTASVVVTP